MSKILPVFLLLTIATMTNAQVKNPVKWNYSSIKIDNNNYEVHITAVIDREWHIYSGATAAGGPVPTTISFSANPLITLKGNVKEAGKLEQHHEKIFGVDVKQYSNKVDFIQQLTLKGNIKTAIKGSVEFMVCNNNQCLPPSTEEFSITLP